MSYLTPLSLIPGNLAQPRTEFRIFLSPRFELGELDGRINEAEVVKFYNDANRKVATAAFVCLLLANSDGRHHSS